MKNDENHDIECLYKYSEFMNSEEFKKLLKKKEDELISICQKHYEKVVIDVHFTDDDFKSPS